MFDGSLPEIADLAALDYPALVSAASGWARAEAAAAARKQAAMAEIFRRSTQLDDARDRELWFVDPEKAVGNELAAAQNISPGMAINQALRGTILRDRLPKVAALFEAGLISDLLARTVVYRTALVVDDDAMAAVDAALAEQVSRWGALSEKKTQEAVDALVAIHDPAAVRRSRAATNARTVEFGSPLDAAGFTSVYARLYAPDAAALQQRADDIARTVCPDDPRTLRERQADAFGVMATGADTLPCECGKDQCEAANRDRGARNVVIHVITTEETLTEAQVSRPAECKPMDVEPDTTVSDALPADAQTVPPPATADQLSPPTAYVVGGGLISPAVLAAFLDRATIRTVRHPGDSPPEPRYRPSMALQDFVRGRDLSCRFPRCDKPAYLCDVDHTVPYPAGPTCASNLKCLCREHHLLKTFWTGESGWRDEQLPDGTVIWTAPDGHSYTTRPGSALLFPTLCTPTAPSPRRDTTETGNNRGLKMPRRRRTRAQDRRYRVEVERRLNDDFVAERNKPPPF